MKKETTLTEQEIEIAYAEAMKIVSTSRAIVSDERRQCMADALHEFYDLLEARIESKSGVRFTHNGGIEKMRNIVILGVSFALLAFSPFALAQGSGLEVVPVTPGPGWKTCPRCQNNARVADDRKKAAVDTKPFDPHDLSGVWGNNGLPPDLKARPPL